MRDAQWIDLSKRGIIIGPNESEELFQERAEKLKKKESRIDFTSFNHSFQVKPDWVEIEYSKRGLYFWEAACVWQDQSKMQVNPIFLKRKFFGYNREELVNHELVHLVRSQFHSPIFEEVLAYQSSKGWRRYVGPIFKNPRESLFFVFSLAVTTILSLWSPFFLTILAVIAGYALCRLWLKQRIFQKAKNALSFVGKELALPILLRLTDEEIIFLARSGEKEIKEFFKNRDSLRIRQLVLHLLPDF